MNTAVRTVAEKDIPDLSYHRLRTALNQFGQGPAGLEPNQRAGIEQQALKEYAIEARVLASSEAREIVLPEDVVEQAIEVVRGRYNDPADFEEDLERNGLTLDMLRIALRRELTVEAVLDRIGAQAAEVDDVEVKLFYYMNQERFAQPETRTLRHILITVNEDYEENRPEAARERLDRIAERVRNKPGRFGEQAYKHSECPTALQEGRLGRLPRGQLFAELEEVAFRLAEGEISPVVESQLGLHLLWCEQIHPEGPVSLAEARPRIVERLQERQRRNCIRNWLAQLPQGDENHG